MVIDNEASMEDLQKYNSFKNSIEDLMLEVAWKDYATSSEEKRTLDSKANIVLVANGVLLGLVVNGFNSMDKNVALIGIGAIILSSICCILALSLRKYSALGVMSTWNALKEEKIIDNIPQAKRNIIATIDKAVADNRDQAKKVGKYIKSANYLFICSLVIVALALMIRYFNSICVCSIS